MKRICLLFSVFALIACSKEDNGISVAPSELAGTYWKETQRLDYEYCDGLLTKKFENNFDGTAIGSAGPSVLFFRADTEIIKYGSLPPMGNQLDGYRQCRYFDFDSSQNIVRIYQDAATPEMELSLETCTSGKIVWSYGDDRTLNGHLYRIETRKTYRRYHPDDMWERSVAGYADHDEIDWSLYQ